MKSVFRRLLRRFGWELRSHADSSAEPDTPGAFTDLSAEEQAILEAVKPYTMTSRERIAQVILGIRYIVQNKIPGAIVECGVWRGGSMMAAARTLQLLGDTERELFLYDTFEGMAEPEVRDRRFDGTPAQQLYAQERNTAGSWCRASLEDVQANFARTGYPDKHVHFVRGKVEETIPQIGPEQIALLRLDTDWYESTRHELIHLYPRLEQWGVMIIDDYGWWQGARTAVDEYVAKLPHPLFLHRIDETGRAAIKPTPRVPALP